MGNAGEVKSLLEAALWYAEQGWAVLPLQVADKDPACPNGFYDATTDEAQIIKWWTEAPYNIGIACGKAWGVFGLDVDYKKDRSGHSPNPIPIDEIINQLEPGPRVISGHQDKTGRHIYFQYPIEGMKNATKLCDGITVRSDGYYFVAPPSIHPESKLPYGWESGWPKEFPECPQWLIGLAQDKALKKAGGGDASEVYDKYITNRKEMWEHCEGGGRNGQTYSLALSLWWRLKEENKVVEVMRRVNREQIKPPLDEQALLKKIKEAKIRWENTKPQENTPSVLRPDEKNPYPLAMAFLANHKYPVKYYRQDFYRYKNNKYEAMENDWVNDELNRWLVANNKQTIAGTYKTNQILTCVKTKPRFIGSLIESPCTFIDGKWVETAWMLPLENGVLDVRKWLNNEAPCLISHSPEFFCRYKLPFSFDEKALCPIWDRVALEIFETEERKLLWEEILGIHLYQPFLIEKMFVLKGEGGNGKGVLRNVLISLLGKENVSSVAIQDFHSGGFMMENTIGKLANIVSDMKDLSEIDEGILKQFVSRETITINRKFKQPIEAKPTAFLTVCTNPMIRFGDKSDGIWRRVVLFELNRQFEGGAQNTNLVKEGWWGSVGELPGILNAALRGLKRVVDRGRLEETPEMKAIAAEWRYEFNPVAQFAEECLEYGADKKESTKFTYQLYSNMMRANGNKPLSAQNFGRQLRGEIKRLGKHVVLSEANIRDGNYSGRFWYGCAANSHSMQYDFSADK